MVFIRLKMEVTMKPKLLLTTIFSLAITTAMFAIHARTGLNLHMFDGRPVSVLVDGVPHGSVASQHEILNLAPGVHRLKVLAVMQHPFGWHGTMTQVFRGNVEIFEGFATYAVIHRGNSLIIEDYEALYAEPVPAPGCLPGYSPFPNGRSHPNHGGGVQNSNCSNTSVYGNDWNGSNFGLYPGTGFRSPMSQDDFSKLLRVIDSKSFESTREDIAMGAIGSNHFTSQQVLQMLNVFTFESTKVKVAKSAYDNVVDPDNYYIVYDAFTFESSINDLQASIR